MSDERLDRLEAEMKALRQDLVAVVIKQERNLGLFAGMAFILTMIGGILAVGKLLMS